MGSWQKPSSLLHIIIWGMSLMSDRSLSQSEVQLSLLDQLFWLVTAALILVSVSLGTTLVYLSQQFASCCCLVVTNTCTLYRQEAEWDMQGNGRRWSSHLWLPSFSSGMVARFNLLGYWFTKSSNHTVFLYLHLWLVLSPTAQSQTTVKWWLVPSMLISDASLPWWTNASANSA